MRIEFTEDVLDLLRMNVASAAITTSLRQGLFWDLVDNEWDTSDVAKAYSIPVERSRAYLMLLLEMGLLEEDGGVFKPSQRAATCILNAYGRDSWGVLAVEAEKYYPTMTDLNSRISQRVSVLNAQPGIKGYVEELQDSKEYAKKFTIMLAEMHAPMARELGHHLKLDGVQTILDVGGGSGIMSWGIIEQHSQVTSTVIDLPNVCEVGREYATSMGWTSIAYHPLDIFNDDLPREQDLILMSDIGGFSRDLFAKFRDSLKEGGRIVHCSNFDGFGYWLSHGAERPGLLRRMGDLIFAMMDLDHETPSVDDVVTALEQASLAPVVSTVLPSGLVVIEALKQAG